MSQTTSEPARPVVAMLYPGHSAEDEFASLEARLGTVALPVVHTWEGPTDHDVEALLELGARDVLTDATRRTAPLAPDAVMWACTSGSFVYGPRGVHEQAGWVAAAAGVPASSTTIAFLEALRALDARAVVVAATYPQVVTAHLVAVLEADGVEVRGTSSHDVPSGEDAGRLDADAVGAIVRAGAALAPDVPVLVPDTALHTLDHLDAFESELGRTVLTANQVTAWWGMRLAGVPRDGRGPGALFGTAG